MSKATTTGEPVKEVSRRQRPGTLRVWWSAARPFTLSAAVTPVLVGSALAFEEGVFNPGLVALVLVASLLVQVATNLVDEYSDHGRPEGTGKLIAPYKVIALGLLSSAAVKRGAMACFAVAGAIGLYLTIVAGWPILALALASAAVAFFYAGSPRPLGGLALGQPLVFVFMGPVMVLGAYYVQSHAFTLRAFWLSLPVACTVTAILAANDLRDLEEDKAAGKRTPVTLFGRLFGRWAWTAQVATAFLIIVALVALRELGPLALLSLLALPQAMRAARIVWRGQARPELARGLLATSRLHLHLGLLLAVGVALGRWV